MLASYITGDAKHIPHPHVRPITVNEQNINLTEKYLKTCQVVWWFPCHVDVMYYDIRGSLSSCCNTTLMIYMNLEQLRYNIIL